MTHAPVRGPRRLISPTGWAILLCAMACGYLVASRSFAYVGIPPAKLFIGELALGGFFLFSLRPALRVRLANAPDASPVARLLLDYRWPLLMFVGCGIACLCSGIMQAFPPVGALQCFAFNYYALYLVPAVWVGVLFPGALARMIRWLAVIHGIYGLLYIGVLNSVSLTIPGSDVPVFGAPDGSAVVILGLLSLPRDQRLGKWTIPVLMLNFVVLLGIQVRAEWLGFALGIAALAVVHRPSRRPVIGFVACGIVFCSLAFVADLKVAAPTGRGGEISTRGVVGRMLATINPDLASNYVENADDVAGTINWREVWWHEIWTSINDSPSDRTYFTGLGYGYPLTGLVNYIDADTGLRTPHNVFYYTLGYAGWSGVACLALFQGSLAWGLWQAFRKTGSPLGLVFWIATLAGAFFSNYLENPFGAVPFYVVIGLSIAPNWCVAKRPESLLERAQ